MFFRESYTTGKTCNTLLGRLFGWSRLYYHLQTFFDTFLWISRRYRSGKTDGFEDVYRGSWNQLELIERCGGKVNISGLENLKKTDKPVIFVGNHMSALETILLPSLILPAKRITYILKQELLKIPIFSDTLKILDCIGVTRKDPVGDFKLMLKEGTRHIKEGTSIIVFPQTTRTADFDPEHFGSAGVKLAKKAGVPIIPVALKTDFLSNGRVLKDFGGIDPTKTVYIKFGEPLEVEGNGKETHNKVINFIQNNLETWRQAE